MTIPANARVIAARRLGQHLLEAYRFFKQQDEQSAARRFQQLQSRIKDARSMLAWNPECGRPARFLTGLSAQQLVRAQRVSKLAQEAGLPHLRELILGRHVLLYAHSDSEVRLLALRHERQLTYGLNDELE